MSLGYKNEVIQDTDTNLMNFGKNPNSFFVGEGAESYLGVVLLLLFDVTYSKRTSRIS